MGLGGVLGMFNSLIITLGNVPPIIATLGTLSIYRGLVFFYSQGTWVNSFELPKSFKVFSKGTALGLPNMVIIAIVVAVVVYYFLNHTRTGRDIYAVGSNEDAAQFAGIRKAAHPLYRLYVERCALRPGRGACGPPALNRPRPTRPWALSCRPWPRPWWVG